MHPLRGNVPPRMRTRVWAIFRVLIVVLACAASGTLECGGRTMTDSELKGAAVYQRMCVVCHGAEGQGAGDHPRQQEPARRAQQPRALGRGDALTPRQEQAERRFLRLLAEAYIGNSKLGSP